MYPPNGATTYQISTDYLTVVDKVANVAVIVALCCIAAVFIVLACLFVVCYCKEGDEEA